jgi:hypothetical protein
MASKPPCPDPDLYVWVDSAEGGYWRRKRGTVKKARLNASFKKNALNTKYINDAGSRIMAKLTPHMDRLILGRSYSTLTGELKKGYNKTGEMNYGFLKGYDLQPKHKMERLLKHLWTIYQTSETVTVQIPIDAATIQNTGGLVTYYYFELILLQGDAGRDNELRIDSDTSEVYELDHVYSDCVMTVHPTKKPWMVLLKLNSIETPTRNTIELALSGSNYGMKVLAVG